MFSYQNGSVGKNAEAKILALRFFVYSHLMKVLKFSLCDVKGVIQPVNRLYKQDIIQIRERFYCCIANKERAILAYRTKSVKKFETKK